jgi:hypothetical protein
MPVIEHHARVVVSKRRDGQWQYDCVASRCRCRAIYPTEELAIHYATLHAAMDSPEHR